MNDITIIMPCYNKEKYIAKALDSIFEQKTKYTMEILIADDCSTDKTLEIVDIYNKKNVIPFRILKSDKNQGLYKNISRAYNQITAPYFTVLDPDDYWMDEFKIQKALEYLDKNPDFTIYSSNILVKKNNETTKYFKYKKTFNFTFQDFLDGKAYVGQTSGTIFRNVVFSKGLPSRISEIEQFTKVSSFRGDSFRNLIHLHEGKCHYDPVCGSVYLITDDGIWTTSSKLKQDLLNVNLYHDLFLYFNKENIELLQISYNLYKTLMKKLPQDFTDSKNQTTKYVNEVFDNLCKLQQTYNIYSKKLTSKNKHNKPIHNLIIRIANFLYNKCIMYID